MAEEFDKQRAAERHESLVKEAQRIRDGLTQDLVNYYYDRVPSSEEEVRKYRSDMRSQLVKASARITDLMSKLR